MDNPSKREPMDNDLKALLKTTEDIVAQARLHKIAKEHKSVGAQLDTRLIYPVDESYKGNRKQGKFDAEKRLRARKNAIGAHQDETQEQADEAVAAVAKTGVNMDTIQGDYETEKQMWKAKSSQANYSLKRKFHFPELQAYKDKMTPVEKDAYRKAIDKAIVRMADKYREECKQLKIEMDINGIFHPEANAHRAHCIYQMKMYKGIRSETIEDPILREFRNKEIEAAQKEQFEREQREMLLRSLDAGGTAVDLKKALAAQQNGTGATDLDLNKIANGERNDKTEKIPQSARSTLNSARSTMVGSRQASFSGSGIGSLKRNTSSHSLSKQKSGIVDENGNAMLQTLHEGSDELDEKDQTIANNRNNKSPEKLINKIKRGKLGTQDPRLFLTDEAARLEKAEANPVKKTRDKNNILDQEMSNWMISSVQKNQIGKTASGNATVGSTTKLSTLVLPDQDILTEFSRTVNVPAGVTDTGNRNMLPFDDFYDMFKTYSAEAHKKQEQISRAPVLATSPDASPKLGARSKSRSKRRLPSFSSTGSGSYSNAAADATAAVNSSRPASAQIALHVEDTNEANTTQLSTEEEVTAQSTNIVKDLAELDPEFEAFLKISSSENERLEKAKNTTSKMVKPKRLRTVAPLGKNAISLLDSRGKASKDAQKGFHNHFKVVSTLAAASAEEAPAMTNALRTDDILGRLEAVRQDSNLSQSMLDETGSIDETSSVMSQESAIYGIGSPYQHTSGGRAGSPYSPGTTSRPGTETGGGRLSRNRSRFRVRSESALQKKKSGLLDNNDEDKDDYSTEHEIPDKLLAVWECLNAPASARMDFICKYSTEAYSAEMAKSVDLWGAVAAYACIAESMFSVCRKLKKGLYVMPMTSKMIITAISAHIPPIVSSFAMSLVPPSLSFGVNQEAPLSAMALKEQREFIRACFNAQPDSSTITDSDIATQVCRTIVEHTGELLQQTLRTVLEDLDDVVPYGNKSCKEWFDINMAKFK